MPAADPPAAPAARQAALLFGVSGALTLVATATEPAHTTGRLVVASADLLACALALLPIWKRWPVRAVLVLAVVGFGLTWASASMGLIPTRAYGTLYVLIFGWVGANQRPWTSLWLVPPAVVAYVVPLLPRDTDPDLEPRAVLMSMFIGVLVAETIARAQEQVRAAHERAARSALLFRAVSQAGSTLKVDEPEALLDQVSDAVMAMGYDGANLALIAPDGTTFTPSHGRGLAASLKAQPIPIDGTVTALVRDTGETQVSPDYQESPGSVPIVRETGVRTAIHVPVFANGRLAAVLHAMSLEVLDVRDEDLEALSLLATTAGSGLEMSDRLRSEQVRSAQHAEEAMTDHLTRLGNRRLADQLLDHLRPGDTVVLLDLDHFKDVNDSKGHAEGDKVLATFAAHMGRQVRMGDSILRYGGEEFLMLLPSTGSDSGQKIVGRLLQSWRDTSPVTTVSAGIATHVEGRTGADTLSAADHALYRAKSEGRDRHAVAP